MTSRPSRKRPRKAGPITPKFRTRQFVRALGGHVDQPDAEARPTAIGWQVWAQGDVLGTVSIIDDRYSWAAIDGIGGATWTLAEAIAFLVGYEVLEVLS